MPIHLDICQVDGLCFGSLSSLNLTVMKKMIFIFVAVWMIVFISHTPSSAQRTQMPNVVLVRWDGQSHTVSETFVVDFTPVTNAESNKVTYTTTIELQRDVMPRSEWMKWFKEFNDNHQQSKAVEIWPPTIGRQQADRITKSGTAEPVSYKITAAGKEIITIKVQNIEFNL
jgi:hypothetical protein